MLLITYSTTDQVILSTFVLSSITDTSGVLLGSRINTGNLGTSGVDGMPLKDPLWAYFWQMMQTKYEIGTHHVAAGCGNDHLCTGGGESTTYVLLKGWGLGSVLHRRKASFDTVGGGDMAGTVGLETDLITNNMYWSWWCGKLVGLQ